MPAVCCLLHLVVSLQVPISVWNDADDDAIPVGVEDDADSAATQGQEGPGACADGDGVDEQFTYMADCT